GPALEGDSPTPARTSRSSHVPVCFGRSSIAAAFGPTSLPVAPSRSATTSPSSTENPRLGQRAGMTLGTPAGRGSCRCSMNASRDVAKLTESPMPQTTSSRAGSMRIVELLIHILARSRRPTCGLVGLLALTALLVTPSVGAQGSDPSHGVPGALPRGFVYRYNDDYHGWPIAPVHEQHPVRSSFLDPRGLEENGLAGYHFGIDISVDDRHQDPGAPSSLFSHRVYAVESGMTHVRNRLDSAPCPERLLAVRHLAYLHVSPTVPD